MQGSRSSAWTPNVFMKWKLDILQVRMHCGLALIAARLSVIACLDPRLSYQQLEDVC